MVADEFKELKITTNDILYSNYLSHLAWFSPQKYRAEMIVDSIELFNLIYSREDNYVRKNFANTYFSEDNCSIIGVVREMIEQEARKGSINEREEAILLTSLLYGMDRIANTVGHYDAYRKNGDYKKKLIFPYILPNKNLHNENTVLNGDANEVVDTLSCDVLYLDPPYNSRQYSDTYHFLENIARWEKPEVFGIARKMDRTNLKSDYSGSKAAEALKNLIEKSDSKHILLSYNDTGEKGHSRSSAKITDDEIMTILSDKGKVTVFEKKHKVFETGKTSQLLEDNKERIFFCTVTQT